MTRRAILLSFVGLAAVSAQAQDVGGADARAIRELHTQLVNAYNQQDVDALLEHIHPDVAYLVPSRPPIEGKDAVRAMYEGIFRRFREQGRCLYLQDRTTEVVVSGDWAWARGEAAVAFGPCGEPPLISPDAPSGSKNIGIYKREDGRWLRYRQMRNGNAPDMNI